MKYNNFEELENEHWATNLYHQTAIPNWFITDGVKDLIEAFDCLFVFADLATNKDVEKCVYGRYPRIEVKEVKGKKVCEFYVGKVDEEGDDDKNEIPFSTIESPTLPLGTLRFEVGYGDAEGKIHIMALMSEH